MTATTPEAGRNRRLSGLLFQANQELADVKAQLVEAYRIAEQERKRADRAGRDVDRLDHRCAELKAEVDDVAREAVEREEALTAEALSYRDALSDLAWKASAETGTPREGYDYHQELLAQHEERGAEIEELKAEVASLRAAMSRPLLPEAGDVVRCANCDHPAAWSSFGYRCSRIDCVCSAREEGCVRPLPTEARA